MQEVRKMKTLSAMLTLAAAAAVASAQVYADCSYPAPPTKVPDGNTATKDEMMAAMKDIKTYDLQVKAYTDCLKLEHDTALAKTDPKISKEQKDEIERIYDKKNDSAIDAEQAVVTRFNEQVKVFNAKKKDKG
jgi:hypothetical protein